MDNTTSKIASNIAKTLGITFATAIGLGGAIAYYNYQSQMNEIKAIETKFKVMLEDLNDEIKEEPIKITMTWLLKLQDTLLIKLNNIYLELILLSRRKRRRLLPLQNLGGELQEMVNRYQARNKINDGEERSENDVFDIFEYFEIHQKYEMKVVNEMTKIIDEMIKQLTNLPKGILNTDLMKLILQMVYDPKKTNKRFFIDEQSSQKQSIFNRKLAELRYKSIQRHYPNASKDKQLYNSASFYIRALELRNKFYHSMNFKQYSKYGNIEDIIRAKKLIVNDITAILTGIEEEHIQWMLNHIEIKQSQNETQSKVHRAVEIDENGNEIELGNNGENFNQNKLSRESSTCSEQDSVKEGQTPIEIFARKAEDTIWFTQQQAKDLKNVLDTYSMMIKIDLMMLQKNYIRKDIQSKRDRIFRTSEKELQKKFKEYVLQGQEIKDVRDDEEETIDDNDEYITESVEVNRLVQ